MECIKLMVVGDDGVGKTSYLITATSNKFPGECKYIPKVFDSFDDNKIMIDGKRYSVSYWDSAGQDAYDRLRPLSYPQTDVFLVFFDIANRASFENIEEKWFPELNHHMPETTKIIVGNKTDLRRQRNSQEVVRYEEAKALAKRLGMVYIECSSLQQIGIQEVIMTAVRAVGMLRTEQGRVMRHYKRGWWRTAFKAEKPQGHQPPVMPPAGLAPWVEVQTAIFADDWEKLLQHTTSSTDVRFTFSDVNAPPLQGHQVLLSAASPIFQEIFITSKKINSVPKKYDKVFEDISWVLDETSGNNLNLVEARDTHEICNLQIAHDISRDMLETVLTFLYTGLPGSTDIEDKDFLRDVKCTAEKFYLSWLMQVCENKLNDEDELNPSIGTYLNDETGAKLKSLFLNNSRLSDVKFRVEDQVVYAHKAVLIARCDVMAAMLGGAFREGRAQGETPIEDATLSGFLAVLEYLYTDRAPIESCDPAEILVLADRFCLPRLVTLCELYITKMINRQVQKKVRDGTKDVINLLHMAQAYNADQLAWWCLNFIATNYSVFESTEEFQLLQGENREYVEENRWPPLSYLNELEEYEQQVKNKPGLKSSCVVM